MKKISYKVANDFVLVQEAKKETGIIKASDNGMRKGVVIAGNEKFQEGMTVYFAGFPREFETYLIIHEKDIFIYE